MVDTSIYIQQDGCYSSARQAVDPRGHMSQFRGHHHITLAVGGAQQDYDFHTKTLGLRSVKKTVIFAGSNEAYHLYYGDKVGTESQLITTFPLGSGGPRARAGSGHVTHLDLSVPVGSLGFWQERLTGAGIATTAMSRFGEDRLEFHHPCGAGYALVEVQDDRRCQWTSDEVSGAVAIRGTHAITVATNDLTETDFHMSVVMGFAATKTDGAFARYETGSGGTGALVDYELNTALGQRSWGLGVGAVHHTAFWLSDNNAEQQDAFKAHSEGTGYMDISERKDRNYFQSVYFRTPAGSLFEAAFSDPKGFLKDESPEQLGTTFQLPPWLEDRRAELMSKLEPINF
jgi:glyoxalase family protein